jgi:hypothetical protein
MESVVEADMIVWRGIHRVSVLCLLQDLIMSYEALGHDCNLFVYS